MGSSEPLSVLIGHKAAISSVSFGNDATGQPLLATGSHDGTVRIWSSEEVGKEYVCMCVCACVIFNFSSIPLQTNADFREINVIDIGSAVWSCTFSVDSSILGVGSGAGTISLCGALSSGEASVLLTYSGHSSYINSCGSSYIVL